MSEMKVDIAMLDALYAAATNGDWYAVGQPWLQSDCKTYVVAGNCDPHLGTFVCDLDNFGGEDGDETDNSWNDADFICALRNAWPTISAQLKAAMELAEQQAKRIAELEQENSSIRELMNCYNLGGWTDAIRPMQRALAAEAKIAELEAARRWIPVSERLPEQGKFVLVKIEYSEYPIVAKLIFGKWVACTEDYQVSCGTHCQGGNPKIADHAIPTHWRELDDLPTETKP